jgi:8-oxo-dGTP pyrophosphatase MutT (NUDIX family)
VSLRLLGAGDPALAPSADLAVARAHVAAARPGTPDHEANRARTLAFADAHPDALLRSCTEGHLTGSALVVDPATRRTVLLLHRKLGMWLQPGGHADGDANLPAVALKEATEETGIAGLRVASPAVDVDVHQVGPPPIHLHLDVRYLVVAPPGAELVPNHESLDMRWVPVDELAGYGVDPGTLRLAAAGLSALDELVGAGAV